MALQAMSNLRPDKLRKGIGLALLCSLLFGFSMSAQEPSPAPAANPEQETRETGPMKRIPRQQALTTAALDGVVRERVSEGVTRPVPGARLELLGASGTVSLAATGDGVFRIFPLAPGEYQLRVEAQGYAALSIASLRLAANEVLTLEIYLQTSGTVELRSRLPRQGELGAPLPAETVGAAESYREFRHRLDSDPNYIAELAPDVLPPVADVFNSVPNRWALQQPDYRRYPATG